MIEENVKTLFMYFLVSGVLGCALGALFNTLSGPNKIRFDAALAIGFLIGSAIGTLVGCFKTII